MLGDLKETLDGFQETMHENRQEHEATRQKREAMIQDLCGLLESCTDGMAETVDHHSQMGSPLDSSAVLASVLPGPAFLEWCYPTGRYAYLPSGIAC